MEMKRHSMRETQLSFDSPKRKSEEIDEECLV